MPSSKKETKKTKEKETTKPVRSEEKSTPKKDPKVLSQSVEERIKELAKKKDEDDIPKKNDKEQEDEKVNTKVAQANDSKDTEEEKTSDTKTADSQSSDEDIPSVKKEETQFSSSKDTDDLAKAEEKTSDEDSESDVEVVQSDSLFSRSIAPILIGIIVGVLTAGSIILFYNNKNKIAFGGPTPTPTIEESPTPEPTSTPSIIDDLTLYDITVLNGSGISGQAADVETLLEDEGFSVLDIGNASTSDFTDTIIQTKEGVPQTFIDNLEQVLSSTFSVEINSVPLSESAESDVVVTIGSLEAQSSSPSATPTP